MIELIPAIDILDGRCVRLTKGNYTARTTYADDPAEVARHFEELGLRRLHVVDLDGAKAEHCVNLSVLERICRSTSLEVDFGGGIKSTADLKAAFSAGAAMVTIGSIAVSQPESVTEWLAEYGAQRFILSADTRNGRICTYGWLRESKFSLRDVIEVYMRRGITRVLCTDILRDGMLNGPNTELYRRVLRTFPGCRLIAGGGVSCVQDILELQAAGVPAVVFGKAYYEGRLNLPELIQRLTSPVDHVG